VLESIASVDVLLDLKAALVEVTVTTAPSDAFVARSSQMLFIEPADLATAPVVRVPSVTEYGVAVSLSVVAVSISNVIVGSTVAVTDTWSSSTIGMAIVPVKGPVPAMVTDFEPVVPGLVPVTLDKLNVPQHPIAPVHVTVTTSVAATEAAVHVPPPPESEQLALALSPMAKPAEL
jgi:hypothetical protein